jgi:hypothetical protein
MTGVDVDARRIRGAFERDLAGYRAPDDLPERARLGGLRRARRIRVRRVAAVAAVACAAAVTVVTIAPWPGPARPGPGHGGPGQASSAGLPTAASVGRAMLTAFDAASGDILYSTEVDTHDGAPVDTYQDWNWPARPVPGQQARWHETLASRPSAAAGSLREVENFWVSYVSPPEELTVPAQMEQTVLASVTMVCYAGTGGCGMNNTETPAGTWSEFRTRLSAFGVSSGIGAGGMFSPATLAHGIAQGQWRVERRTRLGGQQAIVLSETSKGPIAGKVLLWVDARTYLPLKYANDIGGGDLSSGIFAYLPPTAANLALFRPAIPRGYPRSDHVKN